MQIEFRMNHEFVCEDTDVKVIEERKREVQKLGGGDKKNRSADGDEST